MERIEDVVTLVNKIGGAKITFLLGAGFSASAGIPLASDMVEELLAGPCRHAGPNEGPYSQYAFLMKNLGSSRARSDFISNAVKKGGNKLNWAHLLLAKMVEHKKVARILTTNFDPLMVQALAMTGQDIRTYDVRLHEGYEPRVLAAPTVVYLHGQVNSLWLVNSEKEAERARPTYTEVLKEAVGDSCLIVVGYSGASDLLFRCLDENFNEYYNGLYWLNYSPELGDDVRDFLSRHEGTNYLAGYSADKFMRDLVIEEMSLSLPKFVRDPIGALKDTLDRITEFPTEDGRGVGDPHKIAISLLEKAKVWAESLPETKALSVNEAALSKNWSAFEEHRKTITPDPATMHSRVVGDGLLLRAESAILGRHFEEALKYIQEARQFGVSKQSLLLVFEAIALSGKAVSEPATRESELAKAKDQFDAAIAEIGKGSGPEANPRREVRRGNAYYNWAMTLWFHALAQTQPTERAALLAMADKYLMNGGKMDWIGVELHLNWGAILHVLARTKQSADRKSMEAAALWKRADEKFSLAAKITGGDYGTFHNWGSSLLDQGRLAEDSQERQKLLIAAKEKFSQAIKRSSKISRTEKTHYGLGMTLIQEARFSSGSGLAEEQLLKAKESFSRAIEVDPSFGAGHFGLACVLAMAKTPILEACLSELELWRRDDTSASQALVNGEHAFDPLRDKPSFMEFVAKLL